MPVVIGLMSGTSLDGIDAAQVAISGRDRDLQVSLQAGLTYPYPDDLRSQLLDLCGGAAITIPALLDLDDAVAECFAQAALSVQAQAIATGFSPAQLIGSHGQTLWHRPPQDGQLGYSWQVGRGSWIAQRTGIPTVSNFRAADIAAQGQGAPLVPGVDRYWLGHPQEHRCIQNIGGISNVTYLPPLETEAAVQGWDTGPGNSLLDLAVQKLSGGQQRYDAGGQWAAQGTPCLTLVNQWLTDPFFQHPPPKSTGREYFGADYLERCWAEAQSYPLSPADFLATLTELTALSIVHSYRSFLPVQPHRILVGGGGVHNTYLLHRLRHHLAPLPVESTETVGIDPNFKEAAIFAVLAHWHCLGIPGNLPSVTGATRSVVLGELWEPDPIQKS
ncbi:MAG: anhydro-N-acetylmuramic acid kinase [Prochlorotrichaceae cyanobacterium]